MKAVFNMSLPSYDSLLETTAVITTILQFLSGMVVCRKYIKKKSTGESSGFPFICGFLSCSFWLRYGILANESSVMFVNAIGSSLFLLYTLVYYIFTVNKSTYIKQFAVCVALLLLVIVYTNSVEEHDKALQAMGIICCIVTVCFFAAPLTMLLHVIRVKNSESLPLPLIAMSFLVSVQWVIYGVLISDTYIQITNFLGCVLSLMQLSLFVCYPPKSFSGSGYKLLDQSVVF